VIWAAGQVVGDLYRLRQVLINLIGNAIKFTEKGHVVVEVRPHGIVQDLVEIHFAVTDTGIGIPAEKLNTIFENFTQVDASMTRQYGGTGLGLSISTRLVDMMGGHIQVQSQLGIGSQFTFTATFAIPAAIEQVSPTKELDLKGVKVLIVDDHPVNRLIESLEKEWLRAARDRRPLSLIMIDIDFFKAFNDFYGHIAGDVCLQQIATALTGVVRRPGDLVARYGGEEFVILLPGTELDGAMRVADLMQQQIAVLGIEHGKSQVGSSVTVSMGIATLVPEQHVIPATLVEVADTALYEAKKQGRNQIQIGIFNHT
jgi:diguanylate cyclase (GGDEF)-like protein